MFSIGVVLLWCAVTAIAVAGFFMPDRWATDAALEVANRRVESQDKALRCELATNRSLREAAVDQYKDWSQQYQARLAAIRVNDQILDDFAQTAHSMRVWEGVYHVAAKGREELTEELAESLAAIDGLCDVIDDHTCRLAAYDAEPSSN